MSRPASNRPPPTPIPGIRSRSRAVPRAPTRRPSNSGLAIAGTINPVAAGAAKAQRTSKTQHKLVLLPTAPQTKPLPEEDEDEVLHHGYETDNGVRDIKSEGERMNKEQRKRAGYKRITAYCVGEGFKMKVMSSYLKREHNVQPRMFDEAMYVVGIATRILCPTTSSPLSLTGVSSTSTSWIRTKLQHSLFRSYILRI